jgi:DNA-binding IscR family transcriptional regulator
MAEMLGTNPGVVRRTMAGLRDAGYVAAEKGHGGGWTLVTPLKQVSLWGVYEALGEPRLFTLGSSESGGGCALERAADAALVAGLGAARAAFTSQLKKVTLADLIADAEERRGRGRQR